VYEFEMIDTMWRCSKEAAFLRTLLRARLEWNEDLFADNVYWWNQVRVGTPRGGPFFVIQ